MENNNQVSSPSYDHNEYGKKRLLVTAVLLACAIVLIAVVIFLLNGGQDNYTKSATAAAKKVIPDAKVNSLKVAGGFAMASVSSPSSNGQAKSGIVTIFKVNKDGSMTQIANGSSFSPIDLLELGIPLSTQAELTGQKLSQIQQNLESMCGYSGGNVPGYIGFNGSFNPDGWQIDATTLDGLEQSLTAEISNNNAKAQSGEKVVCVSATRDKSNVITDKKTYISTFTLQVQFIMANGETTTHTLTFSNGHYRSYALDGQKI